MTAFAKRVYSVVKGIPKGETRSYKEVAEMAGSAGASRAVGSIMKLNYDETVPCHRVIRSDGRLGEYNRGGTEAKRKKLMEEGAINA